jgi:hypothetical protein
MEGRRTRTSAYLQDSISFRARARRRKSGARCPNDGVGAGEEQDDLLGERELVIGGVSIQLCIDIQSHCGALKIPLLASRAGIYPVSAVFPHCFQTNRINCSSTITSAILCVHLHPVFPLPSDSLAVLFPQREMTSAQLDFTPEHPMWLNS